MPPTNAGQKRMFILFLFMLIACLTAVFIFSAQNGSQSSKLSGTILDWLLKMFGISPSPGAYAAYHKVLRKLAHFSIFALMGVASYGTFRYGQSKHPLIFSVLFCVFGAFFDEFHQYFVGTRSAQITDSMIDIAGSTTACLAFAGILRMRRRKSTKADHKVR